MMDQEFYYNFKEHQWMLFNDSFVLGKEIEDIPLVIVVEYDESHFIWCKKHARYEKIEKTDNNRWTTNSCCIEGIPAFFSYSKTLNHYDGYVNHNQNHSLMKIPVRWRMNIYRDKPVLFVGVDICEIILSRSNNPPIYCSPRVRRYMYGNSAYNLKNEEISSFQESIPYPTNVIENAIDMLREISKRLYGIKPAKSNMNMKDETYIYACLFRPYDLNCYFLTNYVNLEDIPKDCKNAYHIICEKLETTPPKGLKKLYHYNPFVVPMYRALKELGFKDYNLMRLFFNDEKIGDINFRKCGKYDFPFWGSEETNEEEREYYPPRLVRTRNDDMISQEEIDALLNGGYFGNHPTKKEYKLWEKVKFLVAWSMQEKGELVTAKRLHKYTKEEQAHWQYDICNMIYEYFDDLSDNVKNEFLSDGCTRSVHDSLVYEINHLSYVRQELKYYNFTEDLECEINGFRFELPRYTDELVDVGKEMNNCVSSYISSVKNHLCTIVVVRKDTRCLACIEVDRKGEKIVQALGVNNEKLNGDTLVAVILWANKMLLFDESFDLNMEAFCLSKNQIAEYKNLENKTTYFIFTIKELLKLPREDRGCGFYRALATKVLTREYRRKDSMEIMFMPILSEIPNKDECVYIHKVCPDLDCVIEDALSGVEEAQIVMHELYEQHLPSNFARKNFWYMKTRFFSYGFPPLIRFVYDETENQKDD